MHNQELLLTGNCWCEGGGSKWIGLIDIEPMPQAPPPPTDKFQAGF